ncbi:MAG: ChbG/HpnK family deacetylase [Pseudolabrys sp.]
MAPARRQIWLCADDYGISRSVNSAIRELILRGRLNATSVMTAASHADAGEAAALDKLNSGCKRVALGLHVTLTAPFKPLSDGFAPLSRGHFMPLAKLMRAAVARRLNRERLAAEVAAQVQAFVTAFGRPPDFIDGHQHIHLFPQVRDAVLAVAARAAPGAWVRQCGRARAAGRLRGRKELLLDVLSVGFRRKARQLEIATNPAFAGAYNFDSKLAFAAIFPRFLTGLPDGGLIMCHPGFVDDELEQLDPLTHQREREFAFFNSDDFPRLLTEHSVALASPG